MKNNHIISGKNKTCILFDILTIFASSCGIIISLVNSFDDGYTLWPSRLMYFTAQSNIWIIITFSTTLIFKTINGNLTLPFYTLKLVSIAQIIMTCLVYCIVLGPFSPENYSAWSLHNLLTHVFSPILAILGFLFEERKYTIKKTTFILCMIPPVVYILITAVFSEMHLPFGNGVYFPYFFMNYHSPSGIFGFYNQFPYYLGSFYWILIFSLVLISISLILIKINNLRKY